MWSKNCIISPERFIHIIQKVAKEKHMDLFTEYSQNDVTEFLTFIIDTFHTSLSKEVDMKIEGKCENENDKIALSCYTKIKDMYKKDYSIINKLFCGIYYTELTNLATNNHIKIIPESFFTLSLPIPNKKKIDLTDCFDLFTEKEELTGDNAYFNDESKQKEDIYTKMNFWSFPDILIICLKRFNNSVRKNQTLIQFPLENLDLSKYVSGYNKHSYVYDLYGVCNHSGGVMGGHYNCYVKPYQTNKWYLFNDTEIKEITHLESLVSPKAYCFFYRKKS
jgi:ubiquitin C-terminal hydrolase